MRKEELATARAFIKNVGRKVTVPKKGFVDLD